MSALPERCVPCDGGTPSLTRAQAEAHLSDAPGWELDWDGEVPRLRRGYERRDFRAALALVNRIGMLAEEQGHHPDLHITGWNHVGVELWTHAVGGLSINDFVLARAIGGLAERR